MIKMIAFDLDGTICNTIQLCTDAFMIALKPYMEHELSEKDILNTFGLNEEGMVKKLIKNNCEDALKNFYVCYEKLHDACTQPFSGIYEMISFLKQKNIIIPLITGKGEKSCNITLKKIGAENLFDTIMYGSEKYPNKHESIKRLLADYEVKKNEFIYIGDSPMDIEACHTVGVCCCSAAWDKHSMLSKLKELNPEHTYDTVEKLTQYLVNILQNN